MSFKEQQKQNIKQNECKTTKKQRHRKFARFKDKMHGMFGVHKISGFGPGRPLICDVCKQRVGKTRSVYDEEKKKWLSHCEDCESPVK